MPTPAVWQTGAGVNGMLRAQDPGGLNRVGGLSLLAYCPTGAWPDLYLQGGVIPASGFMQADIGPFFNTINWFKTTAASILGTLSVPSQSAPTPTESVDWVHNTLAYSGMFNLTVSRLTSAVLLETAQTSLRFCGGAGVKRTTNGTNITVTSGVVRLPKYIAFHTAAGYQIGLLSSTPIDLTGMDQPWLLVWFGSQSHWVESTLPMSYSHAAGGGWQCFPQRYAYQADCPLLMTFGVNPSSAVQVAAQGGLDLTFPSAATALAVLPLYGRLHQNAATTETWAASLPAPLQTKIQTWYPLLRQFPRTVTQTYGYTAGTDTATITNTFAYTIVRAGGQPWAPLPPALGVARDTSLPGLSVSAAVVDGNLPTDYGPSQYIANASVYTWSLTGLLPSTTPRAAPAAGAVPARLQSRIDSEVNRYVAQPHWEPWVFWNRQSFTAGGNVFWWDPADAMQLLAEVYPLASTAQRTALATHIRNDAAAFPPETIYNMEQSSGFPSAPTGAVRGPFGVPGTHHGMWGFGRPNVYGSPPRRRWLWGAFSRARYYQALGDSVDAAKVTAWVNIIDTDMVNQDWASGHWFAGKDERQGAVENVNRHWAGLSGLVWMTGQVGDTVNRDLCMSLLAKATVTRVAMAHLPRYLGAVGLITLPTDLGSPTANAQWRYSLSNINDGSINTMSWTSPADDPRQVLQCDQFQCFLDDSTRRDRPPLTYSTPWEGLWTTYAPTYRWMPYRLATLLQTAVGAEIGVYASKFVELTPDYWIPLNQGTLGRDKRQENPDTVHQVFLARAWLNGIDAATLERETSYSWIASGADLFYLSKLAESARAYATGAAPTGPQAVSMTDNGPVAKRAKFEVAFQITGRATTNTFLPYDGAPPAGQTVLGITADAEFSDNGFSTFITRPAFWMEDFDEQVKSGCDWFYALGTGAWKVRFAPPRAGAWQYRLRLTDTGGTSLSASVGFTVTASAAKGRIRRAAADTRYFEFEDGTHAPIVGSNLLYKDLSWDDPTQQAAPLLAVLAANGYTALRHWASDWGIWGTELGIWAQIGGGTTGRSRSTALTALAAYPLTDFPGSEIYGRVEPNQVAYFTGLSYSKRPPACKRSTTYRVQVTYQIPVAFTGPFDGVNPHGLCIKTTPYVVGSASGDAIWMNGAQIETPSAGTRISTNAAAATGTGWATLTGTFTTGGAQDFMPVLGLVAENCTTTGPVAYIDRVVIQEDLGGGAFGPNQCSQPWFSSHHTVDQRYSRALDKLVESAETNAIGLLMQMLGTKACYELVRMNDSGGLSLASPGTENAWHGIAGGRSRWLKKAVARYFMARWGHSPAIFAFQYSNESEATLTRHQEAVQEWATYLKSFGDCPLLTDSNSRDFYHPMWNAAPALDVVGIHRYKQANATEFTRVDKNFFNEFIQVATPADWGDTASQIEKLSMLIGTQKTYGLNKPTIRDEYGIYDVDASVISAATASDTTGIWLHKALWAEINSGGVTNLTWYFQQALYNMPSGGTGGVHNPNRLAVFLPWKTFLAALPLHLGGYVEAAAVCSDAANLRAYGQKRLATGAAHLWIDNKGHTWQAVVNGMPVTPGTGTVTLTGMLPGSYTATWISPYTSAVLAMQSVSSAGDGTLVLALPSAVSTDIAVMASFVAAPPPSGGSFGRNAGGGMEAWVGNVPVAG